MKELPLYDASADLVCTITSEEVSGRIELMKRMRDALESIERTDHGMILSFRSDDEVERDVRTFAVDEKRCCEFWGFNVERTANSVRLRWDAPPDARELLSRLERFLTSQDPIGDLAGLL